MANVRITLAPGETPEQAQEIFYKALKAQTQGGPLHTEAFPQPVVEALAQEMLAAHQVMWAKMLKELEEILNNATVDVENDL